MREVGKICPDSGLDLGTRVKANPIPSAAFLQRIAERIERAVSSSDESKKPWTHKPRDEKRPEVWEI
jgi:hypothetical protein